MRHPSGQVRSPTSFRLAPEAQDALTKLCAGLGLTKTQAVELLLLGHISPLRLSSSDTSRRRPEARLDEIRHLIQLARALHLCDPPGRPEDTAYVQREISCVIAEIHRAIRMLWQSRAKHGLRTSPATGLPLESESAGASR